MLGVGCLRKQLVLNSPSEVHQPLVPSSRPNPKPQRTSTRLSPALSSQALPYSPTLRKASALLFWDTRHHPPS
jgi:hypothetical protein